MSRATNVNIATVDPVWTEIRREAEAAVRREPVTSVMMHTALLNHNTLEEALGARVADRLENCDLKSGHLRDAFRDFVADQPSMAETFRADITAVYERDPACVRFLEPVLFFKGFQAIVAHRLSHWLLKRGNRNFSLMLQAAISEKFQVDINPGVKVGRGVFMDHATGVVIGETAVIGDNVSILQGVTLGGTGKTGGDRHPKIKDGVLIGAGAKILGNISVGHCARVASGSVVLKEVPAMTTVAGVPAKVVGEAGCSEPSRSMDQILAEKEEFYLGEGI